MRLELICSKVAFAGWIRIRSDQTADVLSTWHELFFMQMGFE